MTKDEALKLALEALMYASYEDIEYDEACAAKVLAARDAIKEALAEPTSGDYALGYGEGFNDACKRQPEERNFCQRCGKRTADPTTIHTCTPPQGNT